MIPHIDFTPLFRLIFILLPLAAWKVIDIALWLFRHVKISWS